MLPNVAGMTIVGYRAPSMKILLSETERRQPVAIDPVCGMEVDEASAQWTSEYEGKTYYFCSPGCKSAFDREPDRYLNQESSGGGHGSHHH